MRLPTRNEIEKAQILDREVEMREGLKLAKKVDEVRLELVREQNNLNKFKNETIKLVQAELDALQFKRDSLKKENEILERHNSNLKQPFDQEWETIKQVRLSELDNDYDLLQEDKQNVESLQVHLSEIRAKIEKDSKLVELRLLEAENNRQKAQEKFSEAHQLLEQAEIRKAQIQSHLDAEINQVNKKAEVVALQLRDIEVREAALAKSVAELARRERFINSKYKVLMQTQNALKQNG